MSETLSAFGRFALLLCSPCVVLGCLSACFLVTKRPVLELRKSVGPFLATRHSYFLVGGGEGGATVLVTTMGPDLPRLLLQISLESYVG